MELGKLTVDVTHNGETHHDVVVNLDPNRMSLQESVRVEENLSPKQAEALFTGGEIVPLPSVIRVMLWAKLITRFPDLKLSEFDLVYGDLEPMLPEEPEVLNLATDEIEAALFLTDTPLEAVGEGKA